MTTPLPRILAIDDTPANLVALGGLLANEFDLQFATSGPMGVALALKDPPDIILLDVMMPEFDGYETFKRLAAHPSLKDIPVIFVTALGDMDSEVAGLSMGAADYIAKPININIARQRIRNVIERERLRKEVLSQRDDLEAEIELHRRTGQTLRKMSKAVEQSPASVVITDLDANIEYVNARFTEVTGYSASEVIGQNPRILHSGLMPREIYLEMWGQLTQGEAWHGEFVNKRKNGEVYCEEIYIAPVKELTGETTHYVAVKMDVTERKREQEALQWALQEKLALLREVHHRVKNNLQVISSLLRMEGRRSEHSRTQAVLNDMQGRIRSMALLHETIYQDGIFACVELGSYLHKVATQAFASLLVSSESIHLRLQLESVQVNLDQAMPCGMLVSELITNALKHGFPDGRTGEVEIELRPCGADATWQLRVSDNGVGLPEDFELAAQHSLGLQLVSNLAQQMGGTLKFEPGAGFMVQFAVAPITMPFSGRSGSA